MCIWKRKRFDIESAMRSLAARLDNIEARLHMITKMERRIMSSFDDLKAAQAVTDAKVEAVKADVEKLIAALAAVPPAGLTPEQQAALDDAVTHANSINAALGAVDAEVNPPAPAPAPEPAPAPVEEPAPVVEPAPAPETPAS